MASIYLYGNIGFEVTGDSVRAALADIPKGETINVFINSPGGDVYEGIAIYNQLQRRKQDLRTYIDGLAYSAASWIAIVPSPENRFMAKASQFGIHKASTMAGGNSSDIAETVERLNAIDEIQVEIYKAASDLSEDLIRDIMDKDQPLNFTEAKAFGFQEYEPEAVAAKFNFNSNMSDKKESLIARLESFVTGAKGEEQTPEVEEKVEAALSEKLEDAESPAEILTKDFAKMRDVEEIRQNVVPSLTALVEWAKEQPTEEQIKEMVAKEAKEQMKLLVQAIKSTEEVPTAEEAGFEDPEKQEPTYGNLTLPNGFDSNALFKR